MQEFHSKKGRNGGPGLLELMEVTGVSFHMWKVNGGTRQKRGW